MTIGVSAVTSRKLLLASNCTIQSARAAHWIVLITVAPKPRPVVRSDNHAGLLLESVRKPPTHDSTCYITSLAQLMHVFSLPIDTV